MRWAAFDYVAGACAGRLGRVLQEETMLSKIRIISVATATLLASPAFAAWPFAQPAQAEQIGDERIIREIVIDGGLNDAGSDETPANELRPSWLDPSSGALDWRPQRSY
jgi:hypothetical protein